VIRPDGDEVGVFLRQDSLDLPYEPNMESKTAGTNQEFNLEVRDLRVLSCLTNRNAYYHIDTSRCNNHITIIRLQPPLEPNRREKSCT
jgi:hypothetical protein